jgi:hypothetical protein
MTINLALEYIPRRMEELGFGNEYYLRFRHLVMQPSEEREMQAYNQFFILAEEAVDVKVESEFGIFDLSLKNANEMLYEHQGLIRIKNLASGINHIRFIQVIPKHKKQNDERKQQQHDQIFSSENSAVQNVAGGDERERQHAIF